MHGARRLESIRKGRAHPNYRHGWDTKEAEKHRRETMQELKLINNLIKINRGNI
jgi:hypothetical protein